MVTCPITTSNFQARVIELVANHIAEQSSFESSGNAAPAPIIPPLAPVDTPLTPGDTISQIIAYSSPWIDLCSTDPLIANVSRQVLNIEIAYASFCGIGNMIIPGPRTYSSTSTTSDGLAQYARAIQEALEIGSYIQIAIHVPMYGNEETKEIKETTKDLGALARSHYLPETSQSTKEVDLYETWDAWNVIRGVCRYNSRLAVGKIQNTTPKFQTPIPLQSLCETYLSLHGNPLEHS